MNETETTHTTDTDTLREREQIATTTPGAFGELPDGLVVVYDDVMRCADLTHVAGDRQASLDLTSFSERFEDRMDARSAARFGALLERHELDPVADYARIQAYLDDDRLGDRENWLYVWANDDVLLVTNNNPLTGDYTDPEGRPGETGYASYMGLEGANGAVSALLEDIRETAMHVKGVDATARGYI